MEVLDYSVVARSSHNPYSEIESGHILARGSIIPLVRSIQVVSFSQAVDANIGTTYFDEPHRE